MKKNSFVTTFPCFSNIDPQKINQQLQQLLAVHQQQLEKLLTQTHVTWSNFIEPLQQLNNQIDHFWRPIDHLHTVSDNPQLRKAYQTAIQTLTKYTSELRQNSNLYHCYKTIANDIDFNKLNEAQKKVINNALRDFHLAGVDLNPSQKQHFCLLQQQLASLSTQFDNNVLDATEAWYLHIDNQKDLAGIPDYARQTASQLAKKRNLPGWIFTLDTPSYLAVMNYADNKELRKQCYQAYVTRASEHGSHDAKWNNHDIIQKILQARYEKALLLGFKNYAELSLATKMAKNPAEVFAFLYDLLEKARPQAEKEFLELQEFAKQHCHLDSLEAWDLAYASEKMQQYLFSITQQNLRPYFPEEQVIAGLFTITNRLFDISYQPIDDFDRWDPHIKLYAAYDTNGQLCGHFYFDLYTRENKQAGAWASDCFTRLKLSSNQLQTPIGFVNCNFAPPANDIPCLLTHDDVVTLFHEFGHCLHHILTEIDIADISGSNGVSWDAVELPSQFLENWCWQPACLALFAKHFQTNEPLPNHLFTKLTELKHFQGAMRLLRQLEYALFDFILHHDFANCAPIDIQSVINDVRQHTQLIPVPSYNRFQNSFSHIFASEYAAGYYSYLWAEVLSTDAFARFTETSLFDHQASQDFLHYILQRGGSKDMLDCFIDYRGRKPKINALLTEYGIKTYEHGG